jgi:hypothetical protein
MTYIRYSKHARHRMIERGISEKEVSDAIQKGTKRNQDGKIVASYTYFEVVFKKVRDTYYIITVMLRW